MGDPTLGVPDTYALRRRVLLAAVLSVLAFLPMTVIVAWMNPDQGDVNRFDGLLIPWIGIVYLCVTRPLMRPVREAIKLRRRLAYSAYLAEKERKAK
jgi:hypothetical protein